MRKIRTVAGTGEPGYRGDGGPALAAAWGAPKAMRCDNRDELIVLDTENNAVRRIDVKTGTATTIASGHQGGDGGLERPHGCRITTRAIYTSLTASITG